MIESFADMFEASLASQKIKPGSILTARVVEVGDRSRWHFAAPVEHRAAGLERRCLVRLRQRLLDLQHHDLAAVVDDVVQRPRCG